jgi:hypothetical protein
MTEGWKRELLVGLFVLVFLAFQILLSGLMLGSIGPAELGVALALTLVGAVRVRRRIGHAQPVRQ